MIKFKKYKTEIKGHLEIDVHNHKDKFEGKITKWQDVLIHGDPEGLRSLAKLLIKIADTDQEKINDEDLPVGAKEHIHLSPKFDLSNNSVHLIVGRLDAKGIGAFHARFIPRSEKEENTHKYPCH